MKSYISQKLSGIVVAVAMASGAFALPITQPSPTLNYQDFDAYGVTLSAGQSAAGTFDIITGAAGSTTIMAGYANAGATFSDIGGYVLNTPILAATAYFYIRNGNQGNDTVSINLGNSQVFNSSTGSANSFAILDGAGSISFLQNNGIITYSVTQSGTSGGSSFTFDYAQLQVTTGSATPQGVPEGGATVALLGLSLAGLAVAKRGPRSLR